MSTSLTSDSTRGRRWQRLREILAEVRVSWERDGAYSVRIQHPDGLGYLLLRVSESERFMIRARSMIPVPTIDGGVRELWSTSLTEDQVDQWVVEYDRTGGRP